MEADVRLDVLSDDACRHLLANEEVGRIAFVDEAGFPVVLPVNYLLDGELIVFHRDTGTELERVPLRRVAFEVEHLAAAWHSGWSVLVQGIGQDVTDAAGARFEQLRERPTDLRAPCEKGLWLAVEIHHITGRRIRPRAGG